LLNISQKQVVARFVEGGRRRRRERAPLAANATAEQKQERAERDKRDKEREERRNERVREALDKIPERAPLVPVALLGGAFIALPLYAAYTKIRAVEIIRG
jgi:hypothetical protein